MREGLSRDDLEPVGQLDGVAERRLAVQALLVLSEARKVTTPDRSRVLQRGASVDEQLAVGPQHPCDGGQEASEFEELNAVTMSRLEVRIGSSSAVDRSGANSRARPLSPVVSSASMAAETSLATSREPTGSSRP